MSRLTLSSPLVEQLRRSDYRVLVTGASGWLGRASLEMLSGAFGDGLGERVSCFGSSARTLQLRGGSSIDQQPLSEMGAVGSGRYLLLHFACLTKDKAVGLSRDDYVAANRSISALTRAAAERVGVDRLLLLSSGAVYQALDAAVDSAAVHPYAVTKLEDEMLFRGFAREKTGRRVVTARLFNLSGPYINKPEAYALSSFIEQARGGANTAIRINSAHRVVRSYVGVGDLLNVAVAHLLADRGEPYDYFDTAGEREVEVLELAEVVKAVVNHASSIIRPALLPGKEDRYVGDGAIFRSLANRYGVTLRDLREQVRETAEYLGGS
jgi:nucleoside-diphosphate-sugar epimerase